MLKKIAEKANIRKFIAMFLIFTLTFANWSTIYSVIATNIAESKKITFDAYFEVGANKVYEISPATSDEVILNIDVDVKEGYLKDTVVYLNGLGKSYEVPELDSARIDLKQVNSGELLKQTIPLIYNNTEDRIDVANLNCVSTVTISGTHVSEDGENKFEEEVEIQINWQDNSEVILTQEYTKLVCVEKGKLLQSLITIKRDDNKINLPISETQVIANIPKIYGTKPTEVFVSSINTSATNGKELSEVVINEQIVNEDTLTFKVTNEAIKGKVWAGAGQDEYIVTYIYEANFESFDTDGTLPEIPSDITANIQIYNKDNVITSSISETKEANITEGVLSYILKTDIDEISKGKLYANHIKEDEKYEITYNTQTIVNIPYAENIDSISFNMTNDKLYNNENEIVNESNVSYFKTTKISKANFDEILDGERDANVFIKILNNNKEVAIIDRNSVANEDGDYIISYTENYSNLQVETSKPVTNGNLILINEKVINNEMSFTDKEIVSLGKIETGVNEEVKEISLTEVNTGISVYVDRESLSSITENEDVNIEIQLNNKDEDTLFYDEPVFDIILPEEVESIDVKQHNILHAEGLEIENIQKGTIDGKPALRVEVANTQENFSTGVFSNGTKIVLKTDIKLKELCPNKDEKITVKYKNNNPIATLLGVDLGSAQTDLKITAPEEVISIQTIRNDDAGNEVTSIDDGKVAGKIEIFDVAKTKQMEIKVLNNNTVPIEVVAIIGKIPTEGNTSFGIDLGSTFSTKLKTGLTGNTQNATIYYSASDDVTSAIDENWKTEEQIDLSTVKSYLILFQTGFTLEPAGSLTYTYDFEVPASLEHNEESYGAFTTLYNKIVSEDVKVEETSAAEFVGLTTGEGAQLKLELTANVAEGAIVREGQKVLYTATVTNTGKSVAENVVVTIKETELVSITNNSVTIGEIQVGETKEATFEGTIREILSTEEYYTSKGYTVDETGIYIETKDVQTLSGQITNNMLTIKDSASYEDYEIENVEIINENTGEAIVTMVKVTKEYVTELPKIYSKVITEVSAKDLSKNIISNPVNNEIKETRLEASMYATVREEIIRLGGEFTYQIPITGKDEETIDDIKVEIPIIDEIEYMKIEIIETNQTDWGSAANTVVDTIEEFNVTDEKVIVPISNLNAEKSYIIKIYSKVKENIVLEETSKILYNYANVYIADELECSTEKVGVEIAKDNIIIEQECSNQNYYIKPTEKLTFTITIKNSGLLNTKIMLSDNIPELLKVEKMTKKHKTSTIESYPTNKIEDTITLEPEETIVYQIETSLNYIDENEVGEIINTAVITVNDVKINSNEIKLYAEYVEKPDEIINPGNDNDNDGNQNSGDNSENEDNKNQYKISGTAWLDENKNGQMDDSEQRINNMEVYLINSNGETLKTILTDENGEYVFEGLANGTYIVAFKYDDKIYNLTDYQKTGVSSSINSDAIGRDGTAATDDIIIANASIGNINIGLITKETFDLRLDKYISRVVVQTSSGTKEYVQKENTTLAKVDIRAKELKGAKVLMEYNIVITNEGKTAGYAKEIIDYMPRDTEFSSELNSGWYMENDGTLHTTQLKDVLIEPGETKTITVVLTRNMTENNTDTVNNRAEIAISHNQDLITDEDSIAGNKLNGEDDIGSADVIIGVATGSEVIYITLIIICMIIFATGVYFIKRQVLVK